MKIEVIISSNGINEVCTGMTCFNTPSYVRENINPGNGIQGVVIINGTAVKFSYSILGDDGDIFTSNDSHRLIVKAVVPLYIFNSKYLE